MGGVYFRQNIQRFLFDLINCCGKRYLLFTKSDKGLLLGCKRSKTAGVGFTVAAWIEVSLYLEHCGNSRLTYVVRAQTVLALPGIELTSSIRTAAETPDPGLQRAS